MTAPIQITPDQLKLALKDAIVEANNESRRLGGGSVFNPRNPDSGRIEYMKSMGAVGGNLSSAAGHLLSIPQTLASAGGFQYNMNPLSREGAFQNLAIATSTGLNYERVGRMGAAATGTDLTKAGGFEQFKKELESLGSEFSRLGKTLTEATMAVRQFAQTSLATGASAKRGALISTQFAKANDLDEGMVAGAVGTLSRFGTVAGSDRLLEQITARRGFGAASGELLQATTGFAQQAGLMGSMSGDKMGGMAAGIDTLSTMLGGAGMTQTAARTLGTFQSSFQGELLGFAMGANPGKTPVEVLAALQSGDGKELGKAMEAMGPAKEGVLTQMAMSGQIGAQTALKLMKGEGLEDLAKSMKTAAGGAPGADYQAQAEATTTRFDKTVTDFTQSVEKASKLLVDAATDAVEQFKKIAAMVPGADGDAAKGMLVSAGTMAAGSTALGVATGIAGSFFAARKVLRVLSRGGAAAGGSGGSGGSGSGLIVPSSGGKGPRGTGPSPTRTQRLMQGMRGSLRNMRSAKGMLNTATAVGKGALKLSGRALKGGAAGLVVGLGGEYVANKVGGTAGNVISGATTGASIGMTLGSVIPGVGTLAGGLAGAAIGGAYSWWKNRSATSAGGAAPVASSSDTEATGLLAQIEENTRRMVERLVSGGVTPASGAVTSATNPITGQAGSVEAGLFGMYGKSPFDPSNYTQYKKGYSSTAVETLNPTSRAALLMAQGNINLPDGYKMDVTSTFRDAERNHAVGGVEGSRHTTGDAMDLVVRDKKGHVDEAFMRQAANYINKSMKSLGVEALVHDAGSGTHLHLEYEGRSSGRDTGWDKRVMAEMMKYMQQTADSTRTLAERNHGVPVQRSRSM